MVSRGSLYNTEHYSKNFVGSMLWVAIKSAAHNELPSRSSSPLSRRVTYRWSQAPAKTDRIVSQRKGGQEPGHVKQQTCKERRAEPERERQTWASTPTGMTMRPPGLSCFTRASGNSVIGIRQTHQLPSPQLSIRIILAWVVEKVIASTTTIVVIMLLR